MSFMSIGDSIQSFLKNAKWQSKINEIRLRDSWEEIMGKTIAKYTYDIHLKNNTLFISTDIAPLKHELQVSKEQIIKNINDFFESKIIDNVVIK